MGLENQVIFAGFQKDINPFYQTADLFVLSSNYEGFGNVLLEALINGVNIVSTDCKSGPGEILSNGKYGKLVPVNDVEALASGIIEVLKGSSIDQNILQSRAREFHPSQIAKQVPLDYYFQLKSMLKNKKSLFISYDGLLDQLGASQILPYLEGLVITLDEDACH